MPAALCLLLVCDPGGAGDPVSAIAEATVGGAAPGAVDLGRVAAGRRHRVLLRLRNALPRPLAPAAFASGCGCLRLDGPAGPIPPGGVGTLRLTFAVRRSDRRFAASIVVRDGPREQILPVVAVPVSELSTEPRALLIPPGGGAFALTITAGPGVDLRDADVRAAGPGAVPLKVIGRDAGSVRLAGALPAAADGAAAFPTLRIVVRAGGELAGEAAVPVRVAGRTTVEPASVRFRVTGGTAAARLLIAGLGPDAATALKAPGAVAALRADGSELMPLTVDTRRLRDDRVLVDLTASPAGRIREVSAVVVRHGGRETRVPVQAP